METLTNKIYRATKNKNYEELNEIYNSTNKDKKKYILKGLTFAIEQRSVEIVEWYFSKEFKFKFNINQISGYGITTIGYHCVLKDLFSVRRPNENYEKIIKICNLLLDNGLSKRVIDHLNISIDLLLVMKDFDDLVIKLLSKGVRINLQYVVFYELIVSKNYRVLDAIICSEQFNLVYLEYESFIWMLYYIYNIWLFGDKDESIPMPNSLIDKILYYCYEHGCIKKSKALFHAFKYYTKKPDINYIKFLLNLGFDIEREDEEYRTPLSILIDVCMCSDIVELFLDRIKDFGPSDIRHGKSILQMAVENSRYDIVKLLIKRGITE